MSLSFVTAIKRGRAYMDLWPTDVPVLKAAFREVRVAQLLSQAKWYVPPIIAIMLFLLYYSLGGLQGLKLMWAYPQAFPAYTYMSSASVIMSILVMLLIVLYGYIWMALQSYQKLTPQQEHFYRDLMAQLGKEPVERPRRFDLAQALSWGCKNLKDKSFLNNV